MGLLFDAREYSFDSIVIDSGVLVSIAAPASPTALPTEAQVYRYKGINEYNLSTFSSIMMMVSA